MLFLADTAPTLLPKSTNLLLYLSSAFLYEHGGAVSTTLVGSVVVTLIDYHLLICLRSLGHVVKWSENGKWTWVQSQLILFSEKLRMSNCSVPDRNLAVLK